MTRTINNTRNIDYSYQQPKVKKSNTARNSLGLSGLAIGTVCATDSFEKGFGNNVREAVQSYKENADILRNAFTKKDYVNKFIKDKKTKSAIIGVGTVVTATASAMAAGTIIDAISNKTKH